MVLAILAEEAVGYKVSIYRGEDTREITQRMSSVGAGVCTPTHLNVEVWSSMWINDLRLYFNESYSAGDVGYYGRSGLYTTHESVLQGSIATPPYFPDFWRSYKTSDTLINSLSVTSFKSNANYYPPATNYCSDGYLGCHDNCAKAEACTKREASGKECLVVAMMNSGYDRGYFQVGLDNLGVPAYFCFIGSYGVAQYAAEAENRGAPILFYHYEPDLFHVAHKGLFDRVFLPRTDPGRVKLDTGNYGENGYGGKTNNPIDVDYPELKLLKFAASIIKGEPIESLVSRFSIVETDLHDLLNGYLVQSQNTDEYALFSRCVQVGEGKL